jgi:hypothetical protein
MKINILNFIFLNDNSVPGKQECIAEKNKI